MNNKAQLYKILILMSNIHIIINTEGYLGQNIKDKQANTNVGTEFI